MLERADRVNIDPLRGSDMEDLLDPSRLLVCDDPRCEFMARRRENLGSETSGKGSAWNIMIIEVDDLCGIDLRWDVVKASIEGLLIE